MDKAKVLEKAVSWMDNRGWKRLTAKRHLFDQSLFDHTLVELDAMLQLLPILTQPNHFNLSEVEQQVLIVSLLAHDVGKERPEWQEYIAGRRAFISDVDPSLTRAIVPGLCATLRFEAVGQQVLAVIENCINLHMSHQRSDANVVLGMLQGNSRWLTLANVVYHIDNVCSAKGVFEARAALERSPMGKHLSTAYHQVVIRGVSTTFLHKAAQEAFMKVGWCPLLHYGDATLYVASAAESLRQPTAECIQRRLVSLIREAIAKDAKQLMVGSSTQKILAKPELFDYREAGDYLRVAASKVSRKSFSRFKLQDVGGRKGRLRTIRDYLELTGHDIVLSDEEIHRQTDRISSAYPDIEVFCFFRAMMSPELVGKGGAKLAQQEYEKLLGEGTWQYNKPQRDNAQHMAKAVDPFWSLPGDRFGFQAATVEELSPESRTELLVQQLTFIAGHIYSQIKNPPTRVSLADEMASRIMQDLVHPASSFDLAEFAKLQLIHYCESKPYVGKEIRGAKYTCPICNVPFDPSGGKKAPADLIANADAKHSNRGVSHGALDGIVICNACRVERVLRQLLLGERAKELIVVFPRMNIGPYAGDILVRKAQQMYDRAHALMLGHTDDPDRRVWLPLTRVIADQSLHSDIHHLAPDELADILSFRAGEDQQRKSRVALEEALRKAYQDDLSSANVEWGTAFDTWSAAVEAVRAGTVSDPAALRIRAEVYRLRPEMQLVCQTPHIIMIPVSYTIALGKDSETNRALRRLFIALLLGLTLDASVAIVHDDDTIDFQGDEGVAYVPPIASVRNLVGSNWVPVSDAPRWFRAIGLAGILADIGKYSERNGVFEVLTTPTVGHILRRIEQKRAEQNQRLTYRDVAYLRAFEEALR